MPNGSKLLFVHHQLFAVVVMKAMVVIFPKDIDGQNTKLNLKAIVALYKENNYVMTSQV